MNCYLSSDLRNLLSYWDANAYYPKDAFAYIESLGADRSRKLELEISELLTGNSDLTEDLYRATAFDFTSPQKARDFLRVVESYIFGNGPQPDIDEFTC